MRRIVIMLFCLVCLFAATAEANYKLWQQPQIVPHYVLRDYGNGLEQVPNPEGFLPIPAGVVYKPINWDPYAEDPTVRTVVYETTETGNTDAEIFAATPGFREYREKVLRYDVQNEINRLDGVYQAGEKATWPQQREEVMRYGSDGFQTTPYCDKIAAAAGMNREEYILATRSRITAYDDSITAILGQQVALVRAIYEAQTVGDLLAVRWQQGIVTAQGVWNAAPAGQ